jgi:predicted nucleotide-binding protein
VTDHTGLPADALPDIEGSAATAKKVFVVHGRDIRARDGVFDFLRSLSLQPVEWHEAVEATGKSAPFIGDIVLAGLGLAHSVVVLFTPDEVSYLRRELQHGDSDPDGQPAMHSRPNVLFEAGMAMALFPDRTVLVEFGEVRLFTDVSGRHTIRLSNDEGSRHSLAHRLEVAGAAVKWSGAWRIAGDLTPPTPVGHGMRLGHRVPAVTRGTQPILSATLRRDSKGHKVDIHNRSDEAVFNVNLELPEDAQGFVAGQQLPITKLPAGQTVTVVAVAAMQMASHFEAVIIGQLSDGTSIRNDVFFNTMG